MAINYPDLAILAVIVLMGARGGMRGFIAEVSGLAGLLFGLVLIRSFFSPAAQWVGGFLPPRAAPPAAFLALLLAGMLAVDILGALLRKILKISFAGWTDRLLGCGAGLCKGILLAALLAFAAAAFTSVAVDADLSQIRNSRAIPFLLELAHRCGAALGVRIPVFLPRMS
jgi:membrane protein required for colicin V production